MTKKDYMPLIDKGYSWYGCRHSETDWSVPVSIEKGNPWANHWGYLFTPKPLKLKDNYMNFPTRQIPRLVKQLSGEKE